MQSQAPFGGCRLQEHVQLVPNSVNNCCLLMHPPRCAHLQMIGLHALHRLLQLLQEPPRPLRPAAGEAAFAEAAAASGTPSILLLLHSGSMHALQNLPPQPMQQPPSAFAAPQLEQQGGERQRTCCWAALLLLWLPAGEDAAASGLPVRAGCIAAIAKGEQSAFVGSSPEAVLLVPARPSLAKRLVPRLLPLSMPADSSKDAAVAPAASPAVGDVGRVTIGEEMGVSMYSLPDMSSETVDTAVLCKPSAKAD